MTGPRCTCDPQTVLTVCRDIRKEPHLAGCPRWGTPLAGGYVGEAPIPNLARCAYLPTCSHGYNGTATFGWSDGRSQFIHADERVIVSESVSDDPVVRDMYEVRDRCSDLPGTAYHAKKWSDR